MKPINSRNDLAINGAVPMFEQPLHVGRPNIGDRKLFLAHAEKIFDNQWLTNNGPMVQKLEKHIADYHKVKHCVAMCNGTIALEIAIRALELDGEVIIPSYTFIATAHALHWQAITPVFADIDPVNHTLDPEAVRRMITPLTTGIIGVHLWGRVADVEQLQDIAKEYNLKLMFDAAHAFGCSYKQQMVGSFGSCEVFSFHATKFFNTFEGGAVLTNDNDLAEAMRLMRNFGFAGLDNVIHPGTNGKMIEMAAAMGLVNLEGIDNVVAVNKRNYDLYIEELSGVQGINFVPYDEEEANNYQYVVMEVEQEFSLSRDELIKVLQAENVLARKYFWPGCHNMAPFKRLFPHAGLLLPNTNYVSKKVIILPTGTAVGERDVKAVASIILMASQMEKI